MAVVGPLRAILVARAQELFNQLQREAGGVGIAGAALVAVLIPLALAAPTTGAYISGLRLGGLMAHPLGGAGAALTLAGLLVLGAALTPVVFTYAITRPLGEWGQALGLWALAAIGFAGYRRALPLLCQRVRDMREQFLEAT